ncbi:hypothetical protein DM01DRAFT_1348266 [Hesseltinella vesiculosa]|uniref:Galactose oxidase n=1 Tax=Hesseltinella vesiculosa TaxID=101127 RepID=A0A1X2G972_9FUNG|nr:hypothetical protein DM01DRAFT_1348266 [Hesseltinella vesiculosa]
MSVINANTPGNATRTDHTATLAADGSAIYIIGGLTVPAFGANPIYQPIPADLNIWSFNLASSQWQALTPKLSSPDIGEGRSIHTATLLPNSTNILIFGGYRNSDFNAPGDYALIYDYAQNTLSDARPNIVKQNLNDIHSNSAVLYTRPTGESFIFFLFGAPSTGRMVGRVDILNITTPSKMAWLTNNNSPPPNTNPQGNDSQGNNSASGSSSLSSGAIAGIAVGSAVAVVTETGTPDATIVVSDNQGVPSKSKPFEGSTVPSEDRTKPFESPEKPFDGHSQVPEELNKPFEAPDKPVEWSTKPFEGLNKPFDDEPSRT